ncbi:hypothetical protein K438DRAFT_1818465 [Mycena galopus ATCC 62051]|nr:hypothetical protein K438DRAFT_1818465 [Mycena galopus ATCC 62051]
MSVNSHQQYSSSSYAMPAPQMLDASYVEDMSINATADFDSIGPPILFVRAAAQMSADASHEEMSVDIRSMGSSMVLPQHPYSSYVPAPQMQADVSNGEEMSANVPMDSDSMGPSMVTPESQYFQYTPFDGSTVFADNQTDALPHLPQSALLHRLSMLELVQQLFASNPTLATEGNPAYDGEVADTDAFMNDYMKFD